MSGEGSHCVCCARKSTVPVAPPCGRKIAPKKGTRHRYQNMTAADALAREKKQPFSVQCAVSAKKAELLCARCLRQYLGTSLFDWLDGQLTKHVYYTKKLVRRYGVGTKQVIKSPVGWSHIHPTSLCAVQVLVVLYLCVHSSHDTVGHRAARTV